MKLITILLGCLSSVGMHAELFFTPEMIQSHLKPYTNHEIQLLEKDLLVVRSICLDDTHNTDSRFYLATAGSPGSRKTTILEKFVANHPEYLDGVYLDPDPRTLKFMVHTYHNQSLTHLTISQTENYDLVIKNAYEKWKPGSNYIMLRLFEEAAHLGRSIIHGTTLTGTHISDFFSALKKKDYQIVLVLCSCSDELRKQAIEYRNQVVRFYQSSPEDAITKGKFFPQRMPLYFAYADEMFFYWSDDLFSERLAAVYKNGKLEVHDKEAMQLFIEKYESDRASLALEGQEIPSFDNFYK